MNKMQFCSFFCWRNYAANLCFYFFSAISEETKLCLLELICFFNGDEELAEELIEERWFSLMLTERKMLKKTWKYELV